MESVHQVKLSFVLSLLYCPQPASNTILAYLRQMRLYPLSRTVTAPARLPCSFTTLPMDYRTWLLFTYEVHITRDGLDNRRNRHYWSHIGEIHFQHWSSGDVRCGIVGNTLTGRFFIEDSMSAAYFRSPYRTHCHFRYKTFLCRQASECGLNTTVHHRMAADKWVP
jgi:hypothetical protein